MGIFAFVRVGCRSAQVCFWSPSRRNLPPLNDRREVKLTEVVSTSVLVSVAVSVHTLAASQPLIVTADSLTAGKDDSCDDRSSSAAASCARAARTFALV